jgi:hypothetical protein
LILLLVNDLSDCLLWIAHNPMADKPPVAFISRV